MYQCYQREKICSTQCTIHELKRKGISDRQNKLTEAGRAGHEKERKGSKEKSLSYAFEKWNYSRETSRPKILALIQSVATRIRFRAIIKSQSAQFIHKERGGLHTAKNHTQIRTSPEEICHRTATGNVTTHPADIGNSALLANIRQTSLVRVLEGTNLFCATELALTFLDLGKDLVTRFVVLGFLLRDRQFLEFLFKGFGFGHCVE